MRFLLPAALIAAAFLPAADRPDGLYAEIHTSKGLIVARLEPELTPLTVANFVGLAEGTIANRAFDPGHPFYDGSAWHRVVAGHVIQGGIPKSDRARDPGYTFPNEIHAKLSHNRAGILNMANSGPNTNASQFCITLGDRSYLDGDFNIFGEVVDGLDVVMKIAQGDTIDSVRILRVGAKAEAFHPTTESFQTELQAAQKRVVEQVALKRTAEQEWIASHYPKAAGPDGGVLSEQLVAGKPDAEKGAMRVRYRGTEVRYMGHVIGRTGSPIDAVAFGSDEKGVPVFADSPQVFTVQPGVTKINPGLDSALAAMMPGERRMVIVPASLAYGRAGTYPPEVPGKRRFVVSPNALPVYDVEVLQKP
jgi:peptidylprolyl isomerase